MRRFSTRAVLAVVVLSLPCPIAAQIRTEVFASGLQLPLAFVQDPTDFSVFFVVEQAGRIRTIRDRNIESVDFLDVRSVVSSGGERGLLGLAFAPDYASSGRFFVNFTDRNGDTVVARFKRSGNPLVADAGSRFDLRWGTSREPVIRQPFSNHNGGNLAFGPDGYLYVGLGDGGSADDPQNRAQDPNALLGKMLRIDVNVPDNHPTGYTIPPDNPYLRGQPIAALPEIWSIGLRNPWRYSFDDPARGGTGALIIADVGQNQWEEVNYEPRNRGGRNYGWRNREGAHPNVGSTAPAYQPLVDPIHEYNHSQGQSITGGFTYRGKVLGSMFVGRYFFADFIAGRVWSLALNVNTGSGEATVAQVTEHTASLGGATALGRISSFGIDSDGELYIVSHDQGRILKLIVPPPTPASLRIIR
jgi:glucose/arabinose dehydrogenase